MRAEDGCKSCCREEFRPRNFLLTHESPVLFTRAQWSWPIWIYPAYRTLVAVFFTVMIIITGAVPYGWYIGEANRAKWFIYLTNHMFFFLTICTIYQAVVAIYAAITFRNSLLHGEVYDGHPWYLKVEWVLYNLSSCVAVLVTLLYWGLLYNPKNPVHWIDGTVHGANTVYVVLDIFITGIPLRMLHFWHTMLYSAIYLLFSVFYDVGGGTNASNNSYIYSVLDWSEPGTAAIYGLLTVFVAVPIVWLILYGLYGLRVLIHWKLGGDFWTADRHEAVQMT